jgi:hypothetical protein
MNCDEHGLQIRAIHKRTILYIRAIGEAQLLLSYFNRFKEALELRKAAL